MCHQRIKILRLLSGLTLAKCAQALGMRVGLYKRVEDGLDPPSPALIEALAALYDIPPSRVCQGALPPPLAFGQPITLTDDLDEQAWLAASGLAILWRAQMAADQSWDDFARNLSYTPPIPPPIPYRRLMVRDDIPTYLWLNFRHEVRALKHPVRARRRLGEKLLIKPGEPAILGPGRWAFKAATKPTYIRIAPVVE